MRRAKVSRETKETQIIVEVDLDGNGEADVDLDYPFFRHMLLTLSKFSNFDMNIKARGDLPHHIIEDIAITIG